MTLERLVPTAGLQIRNQPASLVTDLVTDWPLRANRPSSHCWPCLGRQVSATVCLPAELNPDLRLACNCARALYIAECAHASATRHSLSGCWDQFVGVCEFLMLTMYRYSQHKEYHTIVLLLQHCGSSCTVLLRCNI